MWNYFIMCPLILFLLLLTHTFWLFHIKLGTMLLWAVEHYYAHCPKSIKDFFGITLPLIMLYVFLAFCVGHTRLIFIWDAREDFFSFRPFTIKICPWCFLAVKLFRLTIKYDVAMGILWITFTFFHYVVCWASYLVSRRQIRLKNSISSSKLLERSIHCSCWG